jgi:hypothetical protein
MGASRNRSFAQILAISSILVFAVVDILSNLFLLPLLPKDFQTGVISFFGAVVVALAFLALVTQVTGYTLKDLLAHAKVTQLEDLGPTLTITAEVKTDSFTVNDAKEGLVERKCRNLHVRVVNHDRDHPVNVETLHFVSERTRVLLEECNLIYDNYGAHAFTVAADDNHVYHANGGKLAKSLRDAGYSGEVDGFIELKTKTDKVQRSDSIRFSVDDFDVSYVKLQSATTEVAPEQPDKSIKATAAEEEMGYLDLSQIANHNFL